MRWYREHGYRFLVLSDHNFLTSVDGLNAVHGADELFLLIKGEEVTDGFQSKPIHINGLDPGKSSAARQQRRDVIQRDRRDPAGRRPAAREPPQLRLRFRRRPSAAHAPASRSTTVTIWSTTRRWRRARYGRGVGPPALERQVITVSPTMTRTSSSSRESGCARTGRAGRRGRSPAPHRRCAARRLLRIDWRELSDYQVTPRDVTITIKEQSSKASRPVHRQERPRAERIDVNLIYTFTGDAYVAPRFESNGRVARGRSQIR